MHDLGIKAGRVQINLQPQELIQEALQRQEGVLAANGALLVNTGKYTGRSPEDRFIVDVPQVHEKIAWGKVNVPTSEEVFEKLLNKVQNYLENKEVFVFRGFSGAEQSKRLATQIVTDKAHQNLFINQLLIRPTKEELNSFVPEFNVISVPDLKCDPEIDGVNSEAAIILHLTRKIILIIGSGYCGEIKKSIFSVMNYLMPERGVFPMHCSANIGKNGDTALFFGLSGTGKTTLSADSERRLIGDDEHGWWEEGVFNFEGGCYAKVINLSHENEPQIWEAIKEGSLLENVILDAQGNPDYDNDTLTENTRAAYPVDYIPNAVLEGKGNIPHNVIFLTADAFGVLPPIAKLTKEQAMYYFLSGYTSKLAGTERGITEPQTTFSSCFGEPFLPLAPMRYAEMLGELMTKYNSNVFMVNTGWVGGAYGKGERIKLRYTRAMVTAALNGELEEGEFFEHPIFKIAVPTSCNNVPAEVLDPLKLWEDKEEYLKQADKLAAAFRKNFEKFNGIPDNVKQAAPGK